MADNKLQAKFEFDVKGQEKLTKAAESIDKVTGAISKSALDVDKNLKQISGSFSDGAKKIQNNFLIIGAAVSAALGSIAVISKAAKDGLSDIIGDDKLVKNAEAVTNALFEITNAQGELLTGADKLAAANQIATKSLEDLEKAAKGTKFTEDELKKSFIDLAPFAAKAGLNINDFKNALQDAAKVGTSFGLTADQIKADLEGIFRGQRLKGNLLAVSLGLDEQKLKEAGDKAGELIRERLSKAKLELPPPKFDLDITLKDIRDTLENKLGDSARGLFESFKKIAEQVKVAFDSGKLEPFFNVLKSILDVVGKVLETTTSFVLYLIENLPKIKLAFEVLAGVILGRLVVSLGLATAEVIRFASVMAATRGVSIFAALSGIITATVVPAFALLRTAAIAFNTALLANPIVAAVTAISVVVVLLASNWDSVTSSIDKAIDKVNEFFGANKKLDNSKFNSLNNTKNIQFADNLLGIKKETFKPSDLVTRAKESVRSEESTSTKSTKTAENRDQDRLKSVKQQFDNLKKELSLKVKEIKEEFKNSPLELQTNLDQVSEEFDVKGEQIAGSFEQIKLETEGAKEELKNLTFEARTLGNEIETTAEKFQKLETAGRSVNTISGAFDILKQRMELVNGSLDFIQLNILQVGELTANGFADAFDSIVTGTKSAQEAFRDFVSSTLRGISRIIIQSLVAQAIIRAIGGGGAKLGAPAATGVFPNNAVQAADGGLILGAGTATSDSIPAMLSNGEFVQPTKAVNYYGSSFMEAIRTMRLPKMNLDFGANLNNYTGQNISGRFAEGGQVKRTSAPTEIRIINDGTEKKIQSSSSAIEAGSIVTTIVLGDLAVNGPISQGFSSAFGVRR
jgi:D-ribose pyranose/furanose isomerase RbsD